MLDATVGGSDADSFLTLAEADEIHAAGLHTDATWSLRPDAEREAALRAATRLLAPLPWVGQRASVSQALPWPRDGARVDGVYVPYDEIPLEVKFATAELAEWLAQADRTAPSAGGKLEYTRVGEIEVKFRYSSGGIYADMPDSIVQYLRPLVMGPLRSGGFVPVRV